MRSTDDTEAFPVIETPPSYQVARPRYFGLTPRGLVVAVALVAFVAAIVALALGKVAVGVLLLVAAILLTALYLEQARRRRESSFDRIAAAAVDHTRAVAGFTGASVRAWTSAGREVAKLRLEAHTRARERNELQYALGGASFEGNEQRIAELKEQMDICTRRIEECAREAQEVITRARSRTAGERLAVGRTQIREP